MPESEPTTLPAVAAHGAARLPSVEVDSYNVELKDDEGFLGDRASKGAFREIIERWRAELRKLGEDPLGEEASQELSKKRLDQLLERGDAEAKGVIQGAIEEFSQELALVALTARHWNQWLPQKVKELTAEGRLNEGLQAAANLAQDEIEHLMRKGYSEQEAREVALPLFILLKPEPQEPDEQDRELAEKEREYQKNLPPEVDLDPRDSNEGFYMPDRLARRLEFLIRQVPQSERARAMYQCESLANGHLNSQPDRNDPQTWAEDVFNDPAMRRLAMNLELARSAMGQESPEDFMEVLCPAEHYGGK